MSWPWHVDTALYAVFFFHLGCILQDDVKRPVRDLRKRRGLVLLLCVAFLYASQSLFGLFPYNTSLNAFCMEGVTLMMNIVGVGLLVFVTRLLPDNWYFDYLGRNTLVLFAVHGPFVYYIYQIVALVVDFKATAYTDNAAMAVLYVFLVTLLLRPVVSLLNRSKVLTGKGRILERMVYGEKSTYRRWK